MDDELERFKREINLTELAAAWGYQVDRRESSRSSVVMRHPATDDKIVVSRGEVDQHWTYFSVRDSTDNGTVIDFLQRRQAFTLGGVRQELRAWLRVDRPRAPIQHYRPAFEGPRRDRAAVAAAYASARDTDSRYLISRKIYIETQRAPRFAGTFRVDGRGNVLFPHCHPIDGGVVGYELKNRGFSGFAAGGRKTYWMSAVRDDDARLVIVEGSIDAFSYHQLFPYEHTRYLSTAGGVGPEHLALIGKAIAAMPRGAEVVTATDSDAAGEKLHERIMAIAGEVPVRRHASPVPKDWNDYLRALDRQSPKRTERRLER